MELEREQIERLIETAKKAGDRIMDFYSAPIEVELKADNSPLTLADSAAHQIILQDLKRFFPELPVISEEQKNLDYEIRKNWDRTWMVDPLDGTKEFIRKNGEFTVNIALIEDGRPVFGIVYLPAKKQLYYGMEGKGAFYRTGDAEHKINVNPPEKGGKLILAGSRSHQSPEIEKFIERQKKNFSEVELLPAGSALKFCLVAEGNVHAYPRLGPTMEWDTAAGHAIVNAAGGWVLNFETGEELTYNKDNLLNPGFIATADRNILNGN